MPTCLEATVTYAAAATSLALGAACRPSSEQLAAPESEERTVQVTVWSERHELFIEHPPAVVGEAVRFVTHVSDLATTEPRTEGPITLRFGSPSGATLEQVEPAPARDGIYLPEIRFSEAGTWSMEIEVPSAAGPDRIALPAIEVHGSQAAATEAVLPDAPEGISFLKEQQWRLGTRTAAVLPRSVTERIAFPAVVSAVPDRRAFSTPPVAGTLVACEGRGLPEVGERVEAGELLAYVRPPLSDFGVRLLEAEADVVRTRLAVELAESANERIAGLYEQDARSKRDLEEASFAAGVARAQSDAAQAVARTLRRSGVVLVEDGTDGAGPALPLFELRAPIGGTVTHVLAALGEHLTVERSVLEILDTGHVHVEALVQVDDVERLDLASAPVFRVARSSGQGPSPVEVGEARLAAVGLEVDPRTQTVQLHYDVINPQGRLRIGMALEVLLGVRGPREGLAVPTSALVDEAGEPVVYVQLGGEAFEKRHVRLGARDAEWVLVTAGLTAGERVVTEGAYAVRLASASGGLPTHSHSH